MHSAAEKLINYWASQGLTITRGNSEEIIKEFEGRYKVKLPKDMRDYYLNVDGMDISSITSYQDRNGFSFWPLSRMKSAMEEARGHTTGYWSFPGQESLFVFADYLDWSWAYAIRLSNTNALPTPVFTIGMREFPIEVANTFYEFLDLYVEDSPILYNDYNDSSEWA